MKDPETPSDDDGWGEAADAAAAPASEAAVDNEWDDPADLEKRVAALRVQRDSIPVPGLDNAGRAAAAGEPPAPEPPEVEPAAPPEVEPAAPPEVEPPAPAIEPVAPPETEPVAPPESEPAAPPETEPAAPPEIEPIAPPATEPAAPPEIEPAAPPEIEPAAPPEIEPAAPPEIEPGTPPEIEPGTPEFPPPTLSNTGMRQGRSSRPGGATPYTAASRDEAPLPIPNSNMLAAAGLAPPMKAGAKGKDKPAKEPRPARERKTRDPEPSLSARQKKFIVGGSVALTLAAVCAVLGWFNSQNYYLRCGTKSITAMQGSFWPWGTSPLTGPAFKPIHVPSDVLCTNQHFDSRKLLEDAFLGALLEQSTALLKSGDAEHVSSAEEQLEQALLLTRAPERSAQRTLAQRLQGDVSYWRGAAQIQAAAELLQKGASQFEEAAAKRPRHSSDANAWAQHARLIESEIHKGPKALRKDEAPKEQPTFQGLSPELAPPVHDPTPTPEHVETTPPDAGMPLSPPDAALPPADAALPGGGVLL